LSALAFVVGVAVMVLLADPPGVVVAVIAVVVVGVLLRTFVPSSVWGRARRRRNPRAAAHSPHGAAPQVGVEPES
jgi:Flp pilus assembly protein TadB